MWAAEDLPTVVRLDPGCGVTTHRVEISSSRAIRSPSSRVEYGIVYCFRLQERATIDRQDALVVSLAKRSSIIPPGSGICSLTELYGFDAVICPARSTSTRPLPCPPPLPGAVARAAAPTEA